MNSQLSPASLTSPLLAQTLECFWSRTCFLSFLTISRNSFSRHYQKGNISLFPLWIPNEQGRKRTRKLKSLPLGIKKSEEKLGELDLNLNSSPWILKSTLLPTFSFVFSLSIRLSPVFFISYQQEKSNERTIDPQGTREVRKDAMVEWEGIWVFVPSDDWGRGTFCNAGEHSHGSHMFRLIQCSCSYNWWWQVFYGGHLVIQNVFIKTGKKTDAFGERGTEFKNGGYTLIWILCIAEPAKETAAQSQTPSSRSEILSI